MYITFLQNTLNITVCGNNVVCQADFCNHVLSCLVSLFMLSRNRSYIYTYVSRSPSHIQGKASTA